MPQIARAGVVALAVAVLLSRPALSRTDRADPGPFARFLPPREWQDRFWANPDHRRLLDLDAKAIAALVPVQAGLKFCRCPGCDASEADDPLAWSVARPEVLSCRKCGAVVPNDKFPAKVENKILEEVVEVRPGVRHHYPYHAVPPESQRYPEERLFLAAKRDHEAREFLARAALYAAARAGSDRRSARLACVILVRFAQVYPSYATHFDRPGTAKFLDAADLAPPYRRDYGTAKWDSSGSLDVPINLVTAFALVRDDPALVEAGRALGEPHPAKRIERDLFRASAEFSRRQPIEADESALNVIRGLLSVGRVLDDPAMVHDAVGRLRAFLAQGFYYDGLWRLGDAAAHRRVMARIDGWIDPLLAGYSDPEGFRPADGSGRIVPGPGLLPSPRLGLARAASRSSWFEPSTESPEILLASWPAQPKRTRDRGPALLGGAGIARLSVGTGDDALDLELRGLGDYGPVPSGRLSMRLAVGGHPVLGDLADAAPSGWGFERSSASRNGLVLVDGLNQRETIEEARESAPGSDLIFFAADPDFQVARMRDRFAYPRSTSIDRHTIVAASGAKSRYAVSFVEVDGGLQHDQIFHADPSALSTTWTLSVPTEDGPGSLLPRGLPFVPNARADDNRWFVQSMGAFRDLRLAKIDRPAQALLDGPERGVRLHVLNDSALTAIVGRSPGGSAEGRAAMILRRRSAEGAALSSVFATVFEPTGGTAPPLRRVGRVATGPGAVAIALETADGPETIVLNRNPGEVVVVVLPDGRSLSTDGLIVRVTRSGPTLAGGTFAEVGGFRVTLPALAGTVESSGPATGPGAWGQFRTSETLPHPEALAGRVLLIRHADGTSRGWTIASAQNLAEGGSRIFVREEAGFSIDPASGEARYDRFPGTIAPGPHQFGVSRIAR